MKINLKKSRSNFMCFLINYLMVSVLSIGLMIPIYSLSYNIIKENTIKDTTNNVKQGMQLLDNEINTINVIMLKLKSNINFRYLKSINHITDSSEYYNLYTFQEYFSNLNASLSISDNCYIWFAQNDIVVNRESVFLNSSNFKYFFNYKNYTAADQMKNIYFGKKYSNEILPSYGFYINQNYFINEMTHISNLSVNLQNMPDTVYVTIFDYNKLMDLWNLYDLKGIAQITVINKNNSEIYYESIANNENSHYQKYVDIECESSATSLKLLLRIPESYYNQKVIAIKQTVFLFILIAFGLAVILSLIFSYKNYTPVRNILFQLSQYGVLKKPKDNEYKYIENAISEIAQKSKTFKVQNEILNQAVSEWLLIEHILNGLSGEKIHLLLEKYDDFPLWYQIIIIKTWQNDCSCLSELKHQLQNCQIQYYKIIQLKNNYYVVIINKYNDINELLRQSLEKIINDCDMINIKLQITVSDFYNDIVQIHEAFKTSMNNLRYMDYKSLSFSQDILDEKSNKFYSVSLKDNNVLYELIIKGDAFEARKIIYRQWYELSLIPSYISSLEQLYYIQFSILLNISTKIGCSEPLPVFDYGESITEIALEIADCVEKICSFISNQRRNQNSVLAKEITDCIVENYCNTDFYMMNIVDKFSLSEKTINKVIKENKGVCFSVYIDSLRIKKSENLLATTKIPINDIALSSGFSSQNSFYKAFKRSHGVSPSAFRENLNI